MSVIQEQMDKYENYQYKHWVLPENIGTHLQKISIPNPWKVIKINCGVLLQKYGARLNFIQGGGGGGFKSEKLWKDMDTITCPV